MSAVPGGHGWKGIGALCSGTGQRARGEGQGGPRGGKGGQGLGGQGGGVQGCLGDVAGLRCKYTQATGKHMIMMRHIHHDLRHHS